MAIPGESYSDFNNYVGFVNEIFKHGDIRGLGHAEPVFIYFSKLSGVVGFSSYQTVKAFSVLSVLIIFSAFFIEKISPIAIILWGVAFYVLFNLVLVRFGVALSFACIATSFLGRDRLPVAFIFTFLSALSHYSIAVVLIMVWLTYVYGKRELLIKKLRFDKLPRVALITVICLTGLLVVLAALMFVLMYGHYLKIESSESVSLRLLALAAISFFIGALAYIVCREGLSLIERSGCYLAMLAVPASLLLYANPLVAGRIVYVLIALLPFVVNALLKKRDWRINAIVAFLILGFASNLFFFSNYIRF